MRSRDLVDLVLLIERGGLEIPTVRDAVVETFRRRARQEIPQELAAPPEPWRGEFAAMAAEVGISARDIDAATGVLRAYWAELRPFE
ncbi:MAG: nucleotidyl transferase AbiEii/AbiGii toxin family protein [Phycisphaerales bacterium]